jgi:hypothetical protein
MILYALTIFTSAFLLFLVQPIMAKQILPWFGGSAAVWTTCLMFFQFLLLFGYAYSDWTTRRLHPRSQISVHLLLLAASLVWLPIVAASGWKPGGDEDPTWRILGLLAATIGLPYFLLATTGPLVQAWFARSFPAGTVYRLFALSNFGSLLALVSYPFVVEPWVRTLTQSHVWSAGYGLFVALCAASALCSLRSQPASRPAAASIAAINSGSPPAPRDYVLWLVLSAMGSFMLLTVTNHITHDVASVPFLWILPLTIYLLTFILCFEGRGWYKRSIFIGPLLVVIGAMAWSLHAERSIQDIREAVLLFSAGLFVCCMFFHGELANMKPPPRYLTSFYLMVALGGALGGFSVGFVAPRVFPTYYELGVGLIIALGIAAYLFRRMPMMVFLLVIGTLGFTSYHVYRHLDALATNALVMTRNFYGTLRVRDAGAGEEAVRRLMHGVIMHGEQYLSPGRRMEPTTYYGESSGVGRAIEALAARPLRVGVIGLGTGTLAAHARSQDVYRFYEINPQVIEIAREYFTFLHETPAKVETILGDARLTMEREPRQNYDLIAVDAFSSDSIPMHLVTREAMAVYLKHLSHEGVLAFHVTNRFLRLAPVLKNIAHEYGLHSVLVSDDGGDSDLALTDWVLVTRNRQFLERPEIASVATPIEPIPGLGIWTDDFNNLFRILK